METRKVTQVKVYMLMLPKPNSQAGAPLRTVAISIDKEALVAWHDKQLAASSWQESPKGRWLFFKKGSPLIHYAPVDPWGKIEEVFITVEDLRRHLAIQTYIVVVGDSLDRIEHLILQSETTAQTA